MFKKVIFLLITTFSLAYSDAHIFVYHRFDDDRHPSTNISSENLRAQFEYFKNNGYKVVPLSLLVDSLKAGKDIPDNWIVLTVDDGYKSFFKNGLPIFKEYGYPFTLFVYVEASARKYGDFMDFDSIKETSKYGEIGYHSYGHLHMVGLNKDRLRQDFKDGISVFEKYMGYKPKYFAFPYGEYDARVVEMAKEFGIEVLINQNTGAVSSGSDIYDLDRTPLMNGTNLAASLSSKFLKAEWIFPPTYPKNNAIDKIIIKTDTNASKGKLFVTGLKEFKDVELQNGVLEYKFKKPLDRYKVRIVLKIGHKTTTKILVKDINAE